MFKRNERYAVKNFNVPALSFRIQHNYLDGLNHFQIYILLNF